VPNHGQYFYSTKMAGGPNFQMVGQGLKWCRLTERDFKYGGNNP